MKERPILFNAPMVRAFLNCTKSQTRRVVKLTEAGHVKEPSGHRRWHLADPNASLACPYGQPGDRLWVRETWTQEWMRPRQGAEVFYRADGEVAPEFEPWIPSIHMFRWASRITLEIVSVRIERLQDISEADAIAEGIVHAADCGNGPIYHQSDEFVGTPTCNPVYAYGQLWEQINGREGHGSWAANPLVWVVEFKPAILDATP